MLQLGLLHSEIEKLAKKLSERQKEASRTIDDLCRLLSESKGLQNQWFTLPESEKKSAATLLEEPGLKHSLPKRPPELTLCASDGSQILPDRNLNIDFFLINCSRICFQLGTVEPPKLDARTRLYSPDNYPSLGLTNDNGEAVSISPEIVEAVRQEQELNELFKLAYSERRPNRPCLALGDGTLIFWHLKNLRDKTLQQRFIERYKSVFEKFRLENLPVASYLSFPGGQDVLKSLQLLFRGEIEDVSALKRLRDRDLFYRYLKPGERSALFETSSDAMVDYKDEDKIFFFYLHTGREIARVELPKWCAQPDAGIVELMHSAIYDDLQKGGGYPMTLMEAHEHASVRPTEKEQVLHLLERACNREDFSMTHSAKSLSKRSAQI
ncbi:MAG: DNA double-strand break repair nuclease NurA [Chlorobiales bacterium]|nr:DNA double-strand break repair nuclease NurA [Chlorobiales bacterium]